jgi:transposase
VQGSEIMQTQGSAHDKEQRRRLAVQRVKDGWAIKDVASFIGVTIRSVERWVKAEREGGPEALAAKPYRGHAKLKPEQAAIVVGWLLRSPMEFGFPTELWTARRVAFLIQREFGVTFHPRYVNQWLTERKIRPQKPQRVPRERNQEQIDEWLAQDGSRIRKKESGEPIWC